MSRIIIDLGFLKVAARFIQARKGGVLYYYRRYPKDVRHHFGGKDLKYVSLKTKDMQEALRQVAKLAPADDAEWSSLRSPEAEAHGVTTQANREAGRGLLKRLDLKEGAGAPLGDRAPLEAQMARIDAIDIFIDHLTGRHGPAYREAREREYRGEYGTSSESFLTPVEAEASRLLTSDPRKPRVLLSEALEEYLKLKNNNQRGPKFEQNTRLYIGKVIKIVGDLPLELYTREHARKVRDKLKGDGLKHDSIRRNLNSINAVINSAIAEFGLVGVKNQFEGLLERRKQDDIDKRPPFTTEELMVLSEALRAKDDDIRHIPTIQFDTGARIAEIVGLRRADVVLEHPIPHMWIVPHDDLGRRLKTDNSKRRVPLVGMSLWAVQRALKATEPLSDGWLFPRYAKDGKIRSDSASGAVNKWLKATTKSGKTSHSFRHSLKARLAAVEAPQFVIDAIGGWKDQSSMASNYGGPPLMEQLKKRLEKIVLP